MCGAIGPSIAAKTNHGSSKPALAEKSNLLSGTGNTKLGMMTIITASPHTEITGNFGIFFRRSLFLPSYPYIQSSNIYHFNTS
jgi:hypothetical protein